MSIYSLYAKGSRDKGPLMFLHIAIIIMSLASIILYLRQINITYIIILLLLTSITANIYTIVAFNKHYVSSYRDPKYTQRENTELKVLVYSASLVLIVSLICLSYISYNVFNALRIKKELGARTGSATRTVRPPSISSARSSATSARSSATTSATPASPTYKKTFDFKSLPMSPMNIGNRKQSSTMPALNIEEIPEEAI